MGSALWLGVVSEFSPAACVFVSLFKMSFTLTAMSTFDSAGVVVLAPVLLHDSRLTRLHMATAMRVFVIARV